MSIDKCTTSTIKIANNNFEKREQDILIRITKHYSKKLGREIPTYEAKEIAENLLNFAQAIYGT